MARWVWPTAAGVVTSVTGVLVNLATDLKTEPWAWLGVVVFTGLGVVIAMKLQPALASESLAEPPALEGVHNGVSGRVYGTVNQMGNVGRYVDQSVNQRAVARENGTIYQAGRDIRSDDAP